MIFSACGKILSSSLAPVQPRSGETVTIHIKFDKRTDAQAACEQFDGQQADGRELRVSILGEGKVTTERVKAAISHKSDGGMDLLPDEDEGLRTG
jgi:RNA recognition motif-containing protein